MDVYRYIAFTGRFSVKGLEIRIHRVEETSVTMRLLEDPKLLDKHTCKLIMPDGSEKTVWEVDRIITVDERLARYMASTHSKCTRCDTGYAEKSYTVCPECLRAAERERITGYKAKAKTVLKTIPKPGVYCEELGKFYFSYEEPELLLEQIRDDIEDRYPDQEVTLQDFSFFGLQKDPKSINLSETIGEDHEDGLELDAEGIELQNRLDAYCEKHALYYPDYSIWIDLHHG